LSPKAESPKVESRSSLSPLCHGTCQSGQAGKAKRRDGGTHVNFERGTGAASPFSSRVAMGIRVSVRQVVGRGHCVLETIRGDTGQPGFLSARFRCHTVSSSLAIQTVLESVLRWLVRRTGQSCQDCCSVDGWRGLCLSTAARHASSVVSWKPRRSGYGTHCPRRPAGLPGR